MLTGLVFRDWSLITGGGWGAKNVKITGPKIFAKFSSSRVFSSNYLNSFWLHFL